MEQIEAAISSKSESCSCANASEHIARLREMARLEDTENVEQILKLVSDVKRFRLVMLLLNASPLCVCEISTALQIEQTLTSHHLSILRTSGIVSAKRRGRWVHYEIADKERVEAVVTAVKELSTLVSKNKER